MDVNDRLEQNQNGSGPNLKPDEKRRYLGTFRERVVLAIKVSQVGSERSKVVLSEKLRAYPNATLLIDQDLAGDAYMDYLKLVIQAGNAYSLLSNHDVSKQTDDPYAFVLAEKKAIDLDNIEI
ncbi:YueI family protein [Fructobacillus sp. M1-13]|uniref:YueI family protein n=1 Tax=Fructobacillus papyriferae TaxID=2713171 RepID=A0ABS5QR03_9LACO|nr:DUF1694 domain-containing protein [Fructobacillus papyriferae]MBS9335619.1 YueI family protein [Fructobacillus papyriferae]MCD2159292.1 YueI family protein [Fructobacillus papyriferae]